MDEDKKENKAIEEAEKELDLDLPEEKEDTSKAVDKSLPDPAPNTPVKQDTAPKKDGWLKRLWRTKKGKAAVIAVLILFVLAVLFAAPVTRYGILGVFIKRSAQLEIVDAATKKPVTQAEVMVGSLSAKTDSKGSVDLKDVPVGEYNVKVTKKNYKDASATYTVPIFTDSQPQTISMEATGRAVVITVTNLLTKVPVKEAAITVGEAASTTDEKGEATMVLSTDKSPVKATVKAAGYNDATADVTVTDQTDMNKVALTPSGSVFYLSKATGRINVMKANLDGTNPAVVVEATGNEVDTSTALLAARDWRYVALLAKRKANVAGQLYLVDGTSGTLRTISEGNQEITLVGWSGHRFIYMTSNNDLKEWQDKKQAIKAYDADANKTITLGETTGTGTAYFDAEYEYFGSPYIIEDKLVYTRSVARGLAGQKTKKPAIMMSVVSTGHGQAIREFAPTQASSLSAKLYEPQEVYFRVSNDGGPAEFYEYDGTSLKSVTNDDSKFFNTFYPTFLVSPSGQKTFWSEPRNGKNALFVGDKNGANSKEIAQQSDYAAYGWFGDEYVLISKDKSELYIASVDDVTKPVKITNYHKAAINFEGYGYGYGGL